MMGSKRCGLLRTAAPNANWWRRLEQVGVPGTACANRRASRLPVRAARKMVARTTKPQTLCEKDCGLCRSGALGRQSRSRLF